MPVYEVKTWIASDYNPQSGWIFSTYPTIDSSVDEEPMRKVFGDQVVQLPLLASQHNTAVKIMLQKSDAQGLHPLETIIYEGEDVLHWFVAYHVPGQTNIEERRYISRILYKIGYYTFMHPRDGQEHVPVAIAETLEELQDLLGEEFSMYDNTAE